MSAHRNLRRFLTDPRGAVGAEFALVSILFLSLMMGAIDMSRLLWELNSAKAATRAAVRLAIVSEPAAGEFVNYNAVSELGLGAGETVPATEDGGPPIITCTSASCSTGSLNSTSFDAIVARMQGFYGRIQPENVIVEYRPVGLGFAGNPYGPDVEPLVTVRITGVQFAPGILQAFGVAPFTMPAVASSLSGEDLA